MRRLGVAVSLLFVACLVTFVSAYRLNVPRVLLPYHPKAPVKFLLEVSDPEGGCFEWRSTRPDIVSIVAVNARPSGCSDRAEISAVSKHPEEQSVIIFAEDKLAGVMLSCGVTVDVIQSVSMETTTKILFLDAAPAEIFVEAQNNEGDTFSSLGGIPFEWSIENDIAEEGHRPLKILPFAQSKYEAPTGVDKLESNGQRGHVILLEGLATGSAKLTSRLAEDVFKNIAPHSIDLLVIANLMLVPSEDVYIPIHSKIRYGVEMIKQGRTEPISMPSKQYYFKLSDTAICSFNDAESEVVARKIGRTEISLLDRNIRAKHPLKPPSAHIYVTIPDSLQWNVSPGNVWVLETGRSYRFSVLLFDRDGNSMFIADNLRFNSILPTEHFSITEKSANGTYFVVTPIKKGATLLKSSFTSIITQDGSRHEISPSIIGEQTVEINDPIKIVPELVAFPYIDQQRYQYPLQAIGGSGAFLWSSTDKRVAIVAESTGIVSSGEEGESSVIASDVRNSLHKAQATVLVTPPTKLLFADSRVEAQVGDLLRLNLMLFGHFKGEDVALWDCRQVPFELSVTDTTIFRLENEQSQRPKEKGCATMALMALMPGSTTVTAKLGSLKATIHIAAFPPLNLHSAEQPLVALGSSFLVSFEGGPRPWVLEPAKYFTKLDAETKDLVTVKNDGQSTFKVICGNSQGETILLLSVGNRKSSSNPLPVVTKAKITICCSLPDRLVLSPFRTVVDSTLPPCPATSHSIYFGEPSRLAMDGYGKCPAAGSEDRRFDSIDSLIFDWTTDDSTLLTVPGGKRHLQHTQNKFYETVTPKQKAGRVTVRAITHQYQDSHGKEQHLGHLDAQIDLNLINYAQAQPTAVSLFNHPKASATIQIARGSGHFHVNSNSDVVSLVLNKAQIEVTPKRPGKLEVEVFDLCIANSKLTIPVKVADIDRIEVEGPDLVEVNGEINLSIRIVDSDGTQFSPESVALMNLHSVGQSSDVKVTKMKNELAYNIKGIKVGMYTFVVAGNQANGRTVKSRPHPIQIFAPLTLRPKQITLLAESVFQLEILGGPQPTHGISFSQNDSAIVKVADNGLIESLKLGYATVTGRVGQGKASVTQDTVVVKVVSLAGVKIRIPTVRVDSGTELFAHVEGLNSDETPFSFGGAHFPLKFEWSLDTKGVLAFESPFGKTLQERSSNRFAVRLIAGNVGQTTLSVKVTAHQGGLHHFKSTSVVFSDKVRITVEESLRFLEPSAVPGVIRLTPDTELPLTANRPYEWLRFSVPSEYSHLVSVHGEQTLISGHAEGFAALAVRNQQTPNNHTAFVGVEIAQVSFIHLTSSSGLTMTSEGQYLTNLPLGYWVTVDVSFRDHRGGLFHGTNTKISYRPHRFDLTDITASNDNRSFVISLNQAGETVLKVWDSVDERVASYLRLSVADVVLPIERRFVIGDVICLRSPVGGDSLVWKADGEAIALDPPSGRAVAKRAGQTTVSAIVARNSTTRTEVIVSAPEHLNFYEPPNFVSNTNGHTYTFPVKILGAAHNASASNIFGCETDDLAWFGEQTAPFSCRVEWDKQTSVPATSVFSVSANFVSAIASYACVVQPLPFDSADKFSKLQAKLVVIVNMRSKNIELHDSASVPFHPAFHVVQSELQLNNLQVTRAPINVIASPSVLSHLTAETNEPNVLKIAAQEQDPTDAGRVQFVVQLSTKSAVLWHEQPRDSFVTITNSLTGQTSKVPVSIKLYGDAPKAAFMAMDTSGFWGFLEVLFDHYHSALLVFTSILATLTILYFGYRMLMSTMSGGSGLGYQQAQQPNGAFASDSPSFLRWRTYGNAPLQSTPGSQSVSINQSKGGTPARPYLWSLDGSQDSPGSFRQFANRSR
uniref:Nuclear pore membrane glycoprotein 210 n=1 Tax=Plectus sambesii TaxID=2011161 RepID=A0A914WHM9_9BILA